MRKRWPVLLLALVLLFAVTLPASAGVLTAGNYSYIISGQEQVLPVDIITVQGTTLVPTDLLDTLSLTAHTEGTQVTLTRGPVNVVMHLGSAVAAVDGKQRPLKSGPLSVSGHLFVPVDILPDLGVSLTVDGHFVLVQDFYTPDAAPVNEQSDPDFARKLAAHTVQSTLRDGNAVGNVTITRLTAELLHDPGLEIPFGARVRLESLLDSQTLFLVTLKNQPSLGATLALDPQKLMPVDPDGHQYDYGRMEVPIDGQVTAALAPGASHTSVLAYDKADGPLTLYYSSIPYTLGRLPAQ